MTYSVDFDTISLLCKFKLLDGQKRRRKMKRLMAILGVGLLSLVIVGTSQAAIQATILSIDFDGPDYVAGTQPPTPWSNEWDDTTHTVEVSVGYLGTQGLVVRESRGVVCDLPTILTPEMGAVSISILFNPQGFPSNWNYGSEGGVQIGWGEKLYGTDELRGVIFHHVGGPGGIYGPGSGYGTYMGPFTSYQWYQITFDVSADWQSMTISAGPVGQTPVSMTTAWSGHEITRIWTTYSQSATKIAYYDNLEITSVITCPPADLNYDCFVDVEDFLILSNMWRRNDCTSPDWCTGADLDTSGVVGLEDLEELVMQWITGIPPDSI